MKRMLILIALIAPMVMLGLAKVNAQGNWQLLSTREVNYVLDRDVIDVTWRDGSFNALKFEVKGGALNMRKCIVYFENGGKQEMDLLYKFGPGRDTQVLDLKGNDRLIEKIEFWYNTRKKARNKAIVSVFGRH
jgi:hypothetical protein